MEWTRIIAAIVLFGAGLRALYSGIRNDGKSRVMIMGWLGYLLDKAEDQETIIRITNLIFGLLYVMLGGALLYIQFKG